MAWLLLSFSHFTWFLLPDAYILILLTNVVWPFKGHLCATSLCLLVGCCCHVQVHMQGKRWPSFSSFFYWKWQPIYLCSFSYCDLIVYVVWPLPGSLLCHNVVGIALFALLSCFYRWEMMQLQRRLCRNFGRNLTFPHLHQGSTISWSELLLHILWVSYCTLPLFFLFHDIGDNVKFKCGGVSSLLCA